MTVADPGPGKRDHPLVSLLVLAGAALVAVAGARDHAGAWNDASRLATVECLVDHHTLAIDRSVFLAQTQDRLWIGGRFYSDKSPVPALLLAGVYQGWKWVTGQTAHERPDRFCLVLTLASSGLAYVVAVWCVYRLGRLLRLEPSSRLLLTASFTLATVAVVYTQHVNNHVLLLGVVAVLMLDLVRLAAARDTGTEAIRLFATPPRLFLVLRIGTLAGLGYATDLGVGPVLLACTLAVVAVRCRRPGPVAACLLAAAPWLVAHHGVNYAVGGTLKPANAVPEYFPPGSPFHAGNMTGAFNHSAAHFLGYAADLLVGKRGFLGHNLALYLALPALVRLLWRRPAELPELLFAGGLCGGTWLGYALTSTNYSGACCSVRWFVPLLAPGYYVLAVWLRRHPHYRADLLVVSGWGAVLAGVAWWYGPWARHVVPGFWAVQAAALVSWLAYRGWRWRRAKARAAAERPAVRKAA